MWLRERGETSKRTLPQLLQLLTFAEPALFPQRLDSKDMIPRYPLVALDRAPSSHVLNRKVLANRAGAVANERMSHGERMLGKESVEEVVEGAVQDGWRTDVGGKRLVVAGCGTVEGLDGSCRVDARRAGVLRASKLAEASYEAQIASTPVRAGRRCSGTRAPHAPIPDTSPRKSPRSQLPGRVASVLTGRVSSRP